MRRLAGLLAAAALAAGCAGTAGVADTASALPASGTWRLPVSFPVLDLGQVRPTAYLQFIRGGLWGAADDRFRFELPFDPQRPIDIDIARLRAMAVKAAAPRDPAQMGITVQVSPPETRFARIGTFTTGGPYVTGLDAPDGQGYFLAYFDRACAIAGTEESEGIMVRYDLAVPSAGFHWIHVTEVKETRNVAVRVADVQLDTLTWRVKRDPG